jgi:cathepsin E
VIPKQSIGAGNTSTGLNGADGILGVGPTVLTMGTLSPDNGSTIPTITDNLFSSGTISENVLGISFEPISDPSGIQTNGELTWGGTDSSKFIGTITYTPITTSFPASTFWGIDASICYGDVPILTTTAGIIDTGAPLIMIASDAFDRYQKVTGGVLDQTTGLLTITSTQYANLKGFSVTISGVTFTLTPNAQILPRNLNTIINGTADNIYLIVSDIGRKSGSGLDFLLGQTFLERFYSVYDTAKARIGLATTPFTSATN